MIVKEDDNSTLHKDGCEVNQDVKLFSKKLDIYIYIYKVR